MIETATSASATELQKTGNWAGADYAVVRTNPSTQCSSDFSTGGSFLGYPTLPLIDLSTMTVLVSDCWDWPTAGAKDYNACVADHL